MANREALRDLQARLASRLQAARDESRSVSSWLAVQAGGKSYLFPLWQAGEIFGWTGCQPVPYSRPWFLGVANLRGHLAGVVDLSSLLGHAVPRTEMALAETSLLLLNPSLEVNAALLVDRLAGLRGIADFASSQPPLMGLPAFYGNTFQDGQGQSWQEIDLQLLAQDPQFLSISS